MSYTDQAIVVPIASIAAAGIAYATGIYFLDDRLTRNSLGSPRFNQPKKTAVPGYEDSAGGSKDKFSGSTKRTTTDIDSERTLKLNYRFRIGICVTCILYLIWYILAYYVLFPENDYRNFCSFAPRIEVLIYTSLRAAILYFFLERLWIIAFQFALENWRYYLILSFIVLAWVFSLFQVFDMQPDLFDGWCDYELGEVGFSGYIIFVVFFAIAHTLLVTHFVGLLNKHKGFVHDHAMKDNTAKASKIEQAIKETRKGFYIYTISALSTDILYVLVYYGFSYQIFEGPNSDTLHYFVPLSDIFYVIDTVISAYSVLSTYGRFKAIFWPSFCKGKFIAAPETAKTADSGSRQKQGNSAAEDPSNVDRISRLSNFPLKEKP